MRDGARSSGASEGLPYVAASACIGTARWDWRSGRSSTRRSTQFPWTEVQHVYQLAQSRADPRRTASRQSPSLLERRGRRTLERGDTSTCCSADLMSGGHFSRRETRSGSLAAFHAWSATPRPWPRVRTGMRSRASSIDPDGDAGLVRSSLDSPESRSLLRHDFGPQVHTRGNRIAPRRPEPPPAPTTEPCARAAPQGSRANSTTLHAGAIGGRAPGRAQATGTDGRSRLRVCAQILPHSAWPAGSPRPPQRRNFGPARRLDGHGVRRPWRLRRAPTATVRARSRRRSVPRRALRIRRWRWSTAAIPAAGCSGRRSPRIRSSGR